MLAAIVAAPFEHVDKTFDIGVDIGVRIFERITDAGLRGEMNDNGKRCCANSDFDRRAIREIQLLKGRSSNDFSRSRVAPP